MHTYGVSVWLLDRNRRVHPRFWKSSAASPSVEVTDRADEAQADTDVDWAEAEEADRPLDSLDHALEKEIFGDSEAVLRRLTYSGLLEVSKNMRIQM